MSTKPSVFVDGDQSTLVMAAYLNDLRTLCYELAGDGTNAPTTAAAVRANLAAAQSGVNGDITSLASGLVLAEAPAARDSSLKVSTTGWAQNEINLTREGASFSNVRLEYSVAAGALTIALKTAAGSDPSTTDPCIFTFQKALGSEVTVTVEAATSITIPAGATLGTVANAPFRLWVMMAYIGGTIALCVQQCLEETNPNVEYRLHSLGHSSSPNIKLTQTLTTATLSTAADACVVYSSTFVAGAAFIVLGCAASSGEAAPGTWTVVPTSEMNPAYRPGDVRAQRLFVHPGPIASLTTEQIPDDNTIPQGSEGKDTGWGITLPNYPGYEPDLLVIRAEIPLSAASAATVSSSIGPASGNALAACRCVHAAAQSLNHTISYMERFDRVGAPGDSLGLRFGAGSAVAVTMCGAAGAGKLGGVFRAFMQVMGICV